MRKAAFVLIALLGAGAMPALPAELHVAVAANFSGPLQRLAPMFEKASGNTLIISPGSSGQLYTQIKQGAPFDVFLSADTDKPRQLENEGLAVPQTAPYGTAAQQVLTRLGLWERLNHEHRIVIGENITQTWQFAATGSADMAFVALSQVLGEDGKISGSSWRVPQSMYDPIEQAAVIIAGTHQQAAAAAFVTWLGTDPAALAAIRAAGYRTAN